MLSVIGHREIPIPDHFDIYHLKSEIEASDKTALQCVMEVDEARMKLEKEAEELAHKGEDHLAHERYLLLNNCCQKWFSYSSFYLIELVPMR